MTPSQPIDAVSRIAPFSELDRAALETLISDLDHRQAGAGSLLGDFDPPGQDGLYLITRGEVCLLDANDLTLEKRQPGELFGHAVTLDGQRPAYRAVALTDVECWHLPASALKTWIQREPLIGRFLESSPGERLRSLASQGRQRLGEIGLREPVTTAPSTSIREAAELMAREQVSSLPVVRDQQLVGILTDRDLRARVVARGVDTGQPIEQIMTPEPVSAGAAMRIDDALVEMMKRGIHHLPVLADDGRLLGVVSSGDLLRIQAPHPLRLARDIQRARSVAEIAQLAKQGPGLLAGLVRHGGEVTEVGRIASMITDNCTRRLVALALEKFGEAPMAWTWLAFGSQARMEQGLISDQDNGLLLAEEPDDEADRYFRRFADFVCDGLNDCGYIYCPGGVMAKGEWRMSWKAWRRRFDNWMVEPEPQAVMQSSIFFDQRPIVGDLPLAERLHEEILDQASQSRLFRRFLAAESMGNRPALGLFGQFAREEGDGNARGVNLKKRGVIPIVDLARVRALEGAIRVVHTEERIQAAADAGVMNSSDADDLVHALRFIGNIRLRHQVRLQEQGDKPNHLVDPDELSGLHRRYLRSAFGIVKSAQKALEQRYMI